MTNRSVIVVGGGIGGLAAAAALHRSGWQVRVLERAPVFSEAGAGISLWSNALSGLDAIGIATKDWRSNNLEINAGIRDPSGRWLRRRGAIARAQASGTAAVLHRADLLQALVDALPSGALIPDAEVTSIRQSADGVQVTHRQGNDEADLLIGADGVRSTVRQVVWPYAPQPRYAGYTAWRMITHRMPHIETRAGETWGAGMRFGYAPLPDGNLYCYATANMARRTSLPQTDLTELRARFGGWHAPIPQLLDAVEMPILRHDIYDLGHLASFAHGRIALLGDAAHAMTPNLGQGAGQAIEDAVTLAAVLDAHSSIPEALTRYDDQRRPRTQSIVLQSRQLGTIAQLSDPFAIYIRNLTMRLVPRALAQRALTRVADWPGPQVP
ncbi:FAD-dependent monooxygenase [Kribbella sp. NPDC003505]|uniref:FAD-dependent monooxygenase n=1 Tax=Kribbella sp. NPDC003505 TaxID=3154448 RepID=UPI0033AF57C4